jgi:toxin ParE1/3/4
VSRYTLGPGVRDDLQAISRYIAQDNPRAAGRLRKLFFDRIRLLAGNPLMGELREDLAPGVRMMTAGNYVILFRPAPQGIEIVQIVHAARELATIFRRLE